MSLKVDDQAVVYNCWHCGKDGLVKFGERKFKLIREIMGKVDKNWHDLTVENGSIDYLKSRAYQKQLQNLRSKIKTLHSIRK